MSKEDVKRKKQCIYDGEASNKEVYGTKNLFTLNS